MRKLLAILSLMAPLVLISGTHAGATHAQTALGPITAAGQLTVPSTAFPGDYKQSASEEWPISYADTSTFAGFHTRSYTALGALGAWYQYAAKPIIVQSGNTVLVSPVEAAYLGTYYRDQATAAAAFSDFTGSSSSSGAAPCSFGERCATYTATLTRNGVAYSGMLRVIQQGNALGEMRVDTAQVTADQVSAATFTANLDLMSSAFVSVVGSRQPTATPTSPPTSTPTQTPVPPTATPVPPTATATATATSTPVPLFVTVALGHRNVRVGAKQTVSVATLPGVNVAIRVVMPDGKKLRHSGAANGTGAYTWAYRQPAGHAATAKRVARLTVTVTDAAGGSMSAVATYTVQAS